MFKNQHLKKIIETIKFRTKPRSVYIILLIYVLSTNFNFMQLARKFVMCEITLVQSKLFKT